MLKGTIEIEFTGNYFEVGEILTNELRTQLIVVRKPRKSFWWWIRKPLGFRYEWDYIVKPIDP